MPGWLHSESDDAADTIGGRSLSEVSEEGTALKRGEGEYINL